MTIEINEFHEYPDIFDEIKRVIVSGQEQFLKEANRTSIGLYWELGQKLAMIAKRYQWGEQILDRP